MGCLPRFGRRRSDASGGRVESARGEAPFAGVGAGGGEGANSGEAARLGSALDRAARGDDRGGAPRYPSSFPSAFERRAGVRPAGSRRGKGIFRRKPIAHGKGARAAGSARFRDHPPMAHDRARTVSAAVKEQKQSRRIASRNDRELAWRPPGVGRFERHIRRDRPHRTRFIEARATRLPAHGTRLRSRSARTTSMSLSGMAFRFPSPSQPSSWRRPPISQRPPSRCARPAPSAGLSRSAN